MKQISFAIVLFSLLLIASCKKDNNAASAGSWSFRGTKYNAAGAIFTTTDSSLDATNANGTLSLYFPATTVTSGSYLIVNYDSVPLRAGQMYIRFIDLGTSQYYFSTGTDNISAAVTVSGGKIHISVPAVNLESYENPVTTTAQLSGAIQQQ